MPKSAFVCRVCGEVVADFLAEIPIDALRWATGVWAVPPGAFARLPRDVAYQEFVTCNAAGRTYASRESDVTAFRRGDALVHEQDGRFRVRRDARPGCCGLHPEAELNVTCLNGHSVGTLHSDECWSPLVLRLSSKEVEEVTVE